MREVPAAVAEGDELIVLVVDRRDLGEFGPDRGTDLFGLGGSSSSLDRVSPDSA